MIRALALVVVLLLASVAGATEPQIVSQTTVREWRAGLTERLSEASARAYSVGYASGAMTALSVVASPCRDRFTVAELVAYLRFTAEETDTMADAIAQFHVMRGCAGK